MGKDNSSRIIGNIESISNTNSLLCPICEESFQDLGNLNTHLDVSHDLLESEHGQKHKSTSNQTLRTRSSSKPDNPRQTAPSNRKTRPPKAGFTLRREHWEKLIPHKSKCQQCMRILTQKTGSINCRRCGKLYCASHCKYAARLNQQANYDAIDGEWCKCCQKCFMNKPGYKDFGLYEDKTDIFMKLRSSNSQDHQLQELQLESRFIRIINGIVNIHRRYGNSILSTIRISSEISRLEKSIVPWKDDNMAHSCPLCSKHFSVMLRKHHCRLCGSIVCDDQISACSNEVPISTLANAASDLPLEDLRLDVYPIETQMRLCSKCMRSMFKKRKFLKELHLPLPLLLRKYESLHNTSKVILSVLPTFEDTLRSVRETKENPNEKDIMELTKLRKKLLEAFAIYDRITKQIMQLKTNTYAEAKIQQSINALSANFIQEKMLPLKSIPDILSSNFSSRNSSPESKTSSELMINNLTITEVKQYRTQLMVLKEQLFLVQEMADTATKQRKFDEASTLNNNIAEIQAQIDDLTMKLGEQGFN
ncbi:LAFE_0D07118g1_1 [Lachancea fermentati]|uniref:LAFE_0D07118g1_1 n=1 Tax=Lachancea fermentati TaxID=4955 RepID=A0A1G4MBG2_LACFM|nr:LAFE_0D07118g1_1 [Lachancea fermentati]